MTERRNSVLEALKWNSLLLEAAAVLTNTRNLISTPDKWCKTTSAKDADGEPIYPSDPNAVCWCLTGALSRSKNELHTEWKPLEPLYGLLTTYLTAFIPYRTLVCFNDHPGTTHEDVLRVLDVSITLLDDVIALEAQKRADEGIR